VLAWEDKFLGPKVKVAINGFGRIGRSLLRILLSGNRDIELVLINDVNSLESCAYTFQYDSIFGLWRDEVVALDHALQVGSLTIPFFQQGGISSLDLQGVDVLQCTGKPYTREYASRGMVTGATRVLISGPTEAADMTLILGANEHVFNGQTIISNGSCTTNALAPLLKVIDEAYGIIGGQMTTVHCYTGSQPTVAQPRDDSARSRAAALSMVPTTTSAHKLVGKVLPHLAGKIDARAIRVPTASVSAIDLTVSVNTHPTREQAVAELKGASAASQVLGWVDKPLVSVDMRARPESLVYLDRRFPSHLVGSAGIWVVRH
jgi:glyceraldehyde 3-phosphate dehydrogenase